MRSIEDEVRFLFNDVIKVNVLTYATAFSKQKPDDFMEALRTSEVFARDVLIGLPQTGNVVFTEGSTSVPSGYKDAWNELKNRGIFNILIPDQYGGKNFPDTVKMAVQEVLLSANPSFFYYLMLTLGVAKLIDQYGSREIREQFCPKLFSGEWSGAISMTEDQSDCDWGAIEAVATEEDGAFSIVATKTLTAAGDHDLQILRTKYGCDSLRRKHSGSQSISL